MEQENIPIVVVSEASLEYSILSTYLSVCCKTSKANLSSLWRINCGTLKLNFDNYRRNKLTCPCWVRVEDLGGANSLESLCRYGLIVGENGFTVDFASLDLGNSRSETASVFDKFKLAGTDLQSNRARTADVTTQYLLYCDVCVGYSKLIESATEAQYIKSSSLPIGYDSIMIYDTRPRAADENAPHNKQTPDPASLLPPTGPRIQFKLFSSNQILPTFLAKVDYYSNVSELYSANVCGNCNECTAVVYCLSDNVRLCKSCDEVIHSANEILKKHHRIPTYNAPPQHLGQCDVHNHIEYSLYCIVCETPICSLCIADHQHELGSEEHLLPLLEAFIVMQRNAHSDQEAEPAEGVASSFAGDPGKILKQRKSELLSKVADVDRMLTQCRNRATTAKQTCRKIAQGAADQLMYWCEKSLSDSLGSKLYYSRRFAEIERATKFINYLITLLPAADFLRAWLNYCRYIK